MKLFTWQRTSYRFKIAYIIWLVFLLALMITALTRKPDRPHIGDPFDLNNPYHP